MMWLTSFALSHFTAKGVQNNPNIMIHLNKNSATAPNDGRTAPTGIASRHFRGSLSGRFLRVSQRRGKHIINSLTLQSTIKNLSFCMVRTASTTDATDGKCECARLCRPFRALALKSAFHFCNVRFVLFFLLCLIADSRHLRHHPRLSNKLITMR